LWFPRSLNRAECAEALGKYGSRSVNPDLVLRHRLAAEPFGIRFAGSTARDSASTSYAGLGLPTASASASVQARTLLTQIETSDIAILATAGYNESTAPVPST
jgi:hypothetical protein